MAPTVSYNRYYNEWTCNPCGRTFSTRTSLDQHLNASSAHWYCFSCERDFGSCGARKQHWVTSNMHDYCSECDTLFDDFDELRDHYEEEHFYCRPCNMLFGTKQGLIDHDVAKHFYCAPCERFFQSRNNLDAHLRSSVHTPKSVRCPGCSAGFVSASALILHFEGGRCSSGVTRRMIDDYVQQHDPSNIITNPRRMITGSTSPGAWLEYGATELAYNWQAQAYECYLCHSQFGSLQALNAHLKSPKHSGPQYNLYRCPRGAGCNTQFRTLSALIQHIESGSCGVQRFKPVKDALDDLLSGMKSIAL